VSAVEIIFLVADGLGASVELNPNHLQIVPGGPKSLIRESIS
jgi:hypothetical protein